MTPAAFLRDIMRPAAAWTERVAGVKSSPDALRFLLAVALQESACAHRFQVLNGGGAGAARGWWQFEQGGGVKGVLTHRTSKAKAIALCEAAAVRPGPAAVWRALEGHDALAYGFARLLLLTDPRPIPTDEDGAWACYAVRLWRPGKPHPEIWPANWQTASICVAAETA